MKLATFTALVTFLAMACGRPEAGIAQNRAASASFDQLGSEPQEAPARKPETRQQQPAQSQPAAPAADVPRLTGDKAKDKATLIAALESVKKDMADVTAAWKKATANGVKAGDAATIERLAQKNKELAAKTAQLQDMLDKLRN